MARRSPYIHRQPASWNEDIESLKDIRLFLVSTVGPTVFILKADDMTESTFKVFIGENQMCSCGGGEGRGRLCSHILFVMLKVLRVPPLNPIAWQLSLVDSELNKILAREFSPTKCSPVTRHTAFLRKGKGQMSSKNSLQEVAVDPEIEKSKQKAIEEDSICSICQEGMTQNDLGEGMLCFCASQCGSNFHKRCFRMLITYNRSEKKAIICPICRSGWPRWIEVMQTKPSRKSSAFATALSCKDCKVSIRSAFFRCASCNITPSYDLCRRCFDGGKSRELHGRCVFVRAEATENPPRWVSVTPPSSKCNPQFNELRGRELNDSDYNLLLSLDHSSSPPIYHHLVSVLKSITRQNEKDNLSSYISKDCVICSGPLLTGGYSLKLLPCMGQHVVHESCVVGLLMESQSSKINGAADVECPICDQNNRLFPALMMRNKKKLNFIKKTSKGGSRVMQKKDNKEIIGSTSQCLRGVLHSSTNDTRFCKRIVETHGISLNGRACRVSSKARSKSTTLSHSHKKKLDVDMHYKRGDDDGSMEMLVVRGQKSTS